MTRLEVEHMERIQRDLVESKAKIMRRAEEKVRGIYSSLKTPDEGGKPHFPLCGLLLPGKHDPDYDDGPIMIGQDIKVCLRCGGVWTRWGFGWEAVGFIDPNQESLASVSKQNTAQENEKP